MLKALPWDLSMDHVRDLQYQIKNFKTTSNEDNTVEKFMADRNVEVKGKQEATIHCISSPTPSTKNYVIQM